MTPSRALALSFTGALALAGSLLWMPSNASDFSGKMQQYEEEEEETERRNAPTVAPTSRAPAPAANASVPMEPPWLNKSERPLLAGADAYTLLLYQRRFEELDRAADDARARNATLSDGQPVLGALYDGVAGCMCGGGVPPVMWAQRRALIEEWRRKNPRSVTAEVAAITWHMAYAWSVRARGWRDADGERRAMDAFANEANTAYAKIANASPAAKADPGMYLVKLNIGLALGWPKSAYTALFAEGTAKYPLYLPLYFAAANYYDQRWYGSNEEERQFVEDAVTVTRARLGETLYARVLWSQGVNENSFLTKEADWARMKAGFERIVADYPDNWNLNNYMRHACLADDPVTVVLVSEKIQKPAADAWGGSVARFNTCLESSKRDSRYFRYSQGKGK